jgi:hypothetical protein
MQIDTLVQGRKDRFWPEAALDYADGITAANDPWQPSSLSDGKRRFPRFGWPASIAFSIRVL